MSTAGDLELTGSEQDIDELSGAATAPSPTCVMGQSGLNHIRSYFGYSHGDPDGGAEAQFLRLTNLTAGNNYTVDIYPSGNYGDWNCYYAEAISDGTVAPGAAAWGGSRSGGPNPSPTGGGAR